MFSSMMGGLKKFTGGPSNTGASFEQTPWLRSFFEREHIAKELGRVVVLSGGDGFWLHYIAEECSTKQIDVCLWWNHHERNINRYYNSKRLSTRINFNAQDVTKIEPYECDTLICDSTAKNEVQEIEDLNLLTNWIQLKPEVFMIRIKHLNSNAVICKLKEWTEILGRGHLVVLKDQSTENKIAYFVPTQNSSSGDELKIDECLFGKRDFKLEASWPVPQDLPVEHLGPMDMSETLAGIRATFNAPNSKTKFLKEIGWYPSKYWQLTCLTCEEPVIGHFIHPLKPLIKDLERWTLPANNLFYSDVSLMLKLDKAPKENHGHYERLWSGYKALASYLRSKSCELYKLDTERIESSLDIGGPTSYKDKIETGIARYDEFLRDPNLWRSQVEEFKRNLLDNRPMMGEFYVKAIRPPSKEPDVPLVFRERSIARIYESMVLGCMRTFNQHIPFLNDQIDRYNFGELFNSIMSQGRHAVCDGSSDWAHNSSYSMLCLEAAFVQLLTDDEGYKEEIRQLFRLFAYPIIVIPRSNLDFVRNVVFQYQGHFIYGRNILYPIRTLSNLVINLCRAAYSQEVSVDETESWILDRLEEGHSQKFGGLIHGEHSAIIMGPEEAELFATKGAEFMVDIGLANRLSGEGKSTIAKSVSDIKFDGTSYVHIPMYRGKTIVDWRWCPVKPLDEIIMERLLYPKTISLSESKFLLSEQAGMLLVNYFFIPTIRLLSVALLMTTSLTPKTSISLAIHEINERLFGDKALIKCQYRANSLSDLGVLQEDYRDLFDFDPENAFYKDWKSSLESRIRELNEDEHPPIDSISGL